MADKESIQARILNVLINNRHTTGEIAIKLGYVDDDGRGIYKNIAKDLKKLKDLGLIDDEKIDRPGVPGAKPNMHFIKKNIPVLSKITQNYYEQSSRWQLSSSNYCKELRSGIIEYFNKRLDDVNLDRLTENEYTSLCVFLYYPSVLYFVLFGTIPLKQVPEMDNQVIEHMINIMNSNMADIYGTSIDETYLRDIFEESNKLMSLEYTTLIRTFISLAQSDSLMGYVPVDKDNEWQKKIESTVFNPLMRQLQKISYDGLEDCPL